MKFVKAIILFVITVALSQVAEISFIKQNHFNLITVNSVFIGFLFTSLSILLGFLNEKIVQFFEKAGALKNVYRSIENGILFSLFSIIISFINLMFSEKFLNQKMVLNSLYGFEVTFIILALYFLFRTLYYLKIIINSIQIDKKKKTEIEKANEELKNAIKKHLNDT